MSKRKNKVAKRRHKRRRETLAKLTVERAKNVPCTDCNRRYPPWVMDCDHVRGDKLFNLSKMHKESTSIERVLIELAKCDTSWAKCHRQRTMERAVGIR